MNSKTDCSTSASTSRNLSADVNSSAKCIQDMLDRCKITPQLLNYVEHFKYPYVNDVVMYERLLKIGQGTFG